MLSQLLEVDHKEEFYQFALKNMNEGNISDAMEVFKVIRGYKDFAKHSQNLTKKNKELAERMREKDFESMYQQAVSYKEKGDFSEAYALFLELGDYKDSEEQSQLCWESI